MTTSDTEAMSPNHQGTSDPPGRRTRRLGKTGRLIDSRIVGPRGLQTRYLRNESQGRADVAALRKAASKDPGELPEVWSLTGVDVPDSAGDAPTWAEIAAHTAMTLYAVHQQSRTDPMFRPGQGLGQAARDLIGPPDSENPSARARFNALVTSTTITELRYHLRGLVSQLRAHGIPLDHAMLADDLLAFQHPGGAKDIRLRWSRQYAWLPNVADATSAPGTTIPTPSTPEN
ncbi:MULTISPECIES: type I-E CRISPR-associated protein Cse2/CasB [Actinomyces]|uniref:Type I-E CRISPR-associated protein Cse2/CasB n=1 Tax=Actinomyces respiraculi TaxID=2744574 RepID=A0A7T0LLE3_9ACTO|nr:MULTISPECIES: type I-E CRISPR-associated protein Cse2/CasB [Actinomyces]QPL05917.1 type I-E CRISPR-associated protein Cse2/CasB [Actinomyces respiraculi]